MRLLLLSVLVAGCGAQGITTPNWVAYRSDNLSFDIQSDPVANLGFEDAAKYCDGIGATLPTEPEWVAVSNLAFRDMKPPAIEWFLQPGLDEAVYDANAGHYFVDEGAVHMFRCAHLY